MTVRGWFKFYRPWLAVLGVVEILFGLSRSELVWAARSGTVNQSNVVLLDEPSVQGSPIDNLIQGAEVTVANYPENGFYKVRTATGQVGFIPENVLELAPLPSSQAVDQAVADLEVERETDSQLPSYNYQVRAWLGLTSYRSDMINTELIGTTLSPFLGVLGGVEGVFYFFYQFSLVVHISLMQQATIFRDENQLAYPISMQAIPLLVGLEYIMSFGNVYLNLGVLPGITLGRLSSCQIQDNLSETALNSYLSLNPTLLGRILVNWEFSSPFSLLVSVGYNYQIGGLIDASNEVNQGISILNSHFKMDFSGFFGWVGLGLYL